jgi:hypothetical protein
LGAGVGKSGFVSGFVSAFAAEFSIADFSISDLGLLLMPAKLRLLLPCHCERNNPGFNEKLGLLRRRLGSSQ